MYGKLTKKGNGYGLPILNTIAQSRAFTDDRGYQRPANWLKNTTDAEKKKAGWCRIDIPRVPKGKDVDSYEDAWVGGAVVRTHTLVDTPPPPPLPKLGEPGYDHASFRFNEYPPESELLIALWENVVEGRPEASQALEVKRQAIKAKYPKPAEPEGA